MYAEAYYKLRHRHGITSELAYEKLYEPNLYGMMMVKVGDTDAFLSGLTYEYPEVIRPALQIFNPVPEPAASPASIWSL